jgi:hypothetical protein
MAKKPKQLSTEEVGAKVYAKSQESVGWFDSRLSRERQRVTGYYNGELPKRQHEGSSTYVSTDVYDAVEMLKAQLLEVFSGGDKIAQFDPDNDMAAGDCLVATEYASYVIFRENPGFQLFNDVIHDGLTARAGVVKVFWEEKFDYREETFENLQPHEAMGLAGQDDVDEFDGDLDEQSFTYSGTLVRKIDLSKVSIVAMAPEEFLIAPRSISIPASQYCGHRTLKTKAELVDMGYDKDVVDSLQYGDEKTLELTPEAMERHRPVETVLGLNTSIQPELDSVMLYESYVKMVIDYAKGVRLYKICHVGSIVLDEPQEVDRAPFLAYVPLPIPHAFFGNNFAARVIPFQNAQTVLTRAVLDHSSITTNPRWAVVKGGLTNPREMLENRLGGIVNVSRPDSVTALQYPNLNPFVFEVLGKLNQDKEQSTGISALSQGLNKDAISKQNSQGLVGDLVTLASQRQKISARHFAYNFFVPLMLEVIRLAILHEKKPKMIEVAGAPLNVSVDGWTERTTCSVSMHLGYGEKDKVVQELTTGYAMMAQDPVIEPIFGQQQRYAMAQDIMKLRGWSGRARYLGTPTPQTQPQPDPLKVAEVQAKQTQANAQMITAQTDQQKLGAHQQIEGVKLHQKQQDTVIKALQHDRENDRQDADVANRISVSQQELKLAKTAQSKEAVISP